MDFIACLFIIFSEPVQYLMDFAFPFGRSCNVFNAPTLLLVGVCVKQNRLFGLGSDKIKGDTR